MINREAAQYSLQRAKIILTEAEHLRDQEIWNLVVAPEKTRTVLTTVQKLVSDSSS